MYLCVSDRLALRCGLTQGLKRLESLYNSLRVSLLPRLHIPPKISETTACDTKPPADTLSEAPTDPQENNTPRTRHKATENGIPPPQNCLQSGQIHDLATCHFTPQKQPTSYPPSDHHHPPSQHHPTLVLLHPPPNRPNRTPLLPAVQRPLLPPKPHHPHHRRRPRPRPNPSRSPPLRRRQSPRPRPPPPNPRVPLRPAVLPLRRPNRPPS